MFNSSHTSRQRTCPGTKRAFIAVPRTVFLAEATAAAGARHLESCHLRCRTYVRARTCMTYDIARATYDIVLYIVRAMSYVRYTGYIWNRHRLYRNRVFITYLYVLVRTRYIPVQERYFSTDRYIPVHTEYVPE